MNKKGFTLVELLAVIAILAILVIIALPNVVGTFQESKKDTFVNEIRSIYSAAKQEWVMDSTEGIQQRTYGNCDGCSYKSLDLSGRKELKYHITIDQEGKVIEFEADDGDNHYSYSGPDLKKNEINLVESAPGTNNNNNNNNNNNTQQGYLNDRFCFFIPNNEFTSYTKEYVPMHAGSTWGEFFDYVTTNTVDGFSYKLHSVFDTSLREYRPGDPDFETKLNEPSSYVYYTLEYNDTLISYRGKYNNSTHVEWETIDAFGTSLTDWQYRKIADHLDDVIKNDTLGCYGQGWG